MRSVVVTLLLAVAGVLLPTVPAVACSCAEATLDDVVALHCDVAVVALGDTGGPDEELAVPSPSPATDPAADPPDGYAGTTSAWQLLAATLATVAVVGALVVLRRRRADRP